ncbi:MAG: bifunctional 5,10-methylenetetrahydrofolate dehydrogenase/5,10-methenyltetrahydrofolate cyclohydrolase [Leptospirillia bacterium]
MPLQNQHTPHPGTDIKSSLIDGKRIAARIRQTLKKEVEALSDSGIRVRLEVIMVGEDPASEIYVRNKERAAAEVGITSVTHRLSGDVTEQQVMALIRARNQSPAVTGMILQLPVPPHLHSTRLLDAIDPDKDVDGFTTISQGRFSIGVEGFLPCTPLGVMRLLTEAGIDPAGKQAVVVGRGHVGMPLAMLLTRADATVTVCHSKTPDLAEQTRRADILVAAAGAPRLITGEMIRPGAVVIDVGIHSVPQGGLTGDVDFASAQAVAGRITPVPGGVGPMTVAMLLANTVQAAHRSRAAGAAPTVY